MKFTSQEFWRTKVGNVKKIPLLSRNCYKTLYFDFVPNNVNQKIFLSGCDGREMFVPSKLLWMLWTRMMQETGPGTKRWTWYYFHLGNKRGNILFSHSHTPVPILSKERLRYSTFKFTPTQVIQPSLLATMPQESHNI